jgi:hypothetical protein
MRGSIFAARPAHAKQRVRKPRRVKPVLPRGAKLARAICRSNRPRRAA